MSMKKLISSSSAKTYSYEEQQAKINEVRKLLGPLCLKAPTFCWDSSVARYLSATNWNVKKASKMMKDSLRWRLDHKPETICWEDVAHEASTGKIYRAKYLDKYGRTVLIIRPGFQKSSTKSQIKYLVYCMENAILNTRTDQEEMVWLIDLHNWNSTNVSVKVTRETAHILQNYYPERLAVAILYNPPKIFESFWMIVKPCLEKKTYKKVKFVYSEDPKSQKIMEELFDLDKLETAFGGQNLTSFDYKEYGERMKEDDRKKLFLSNSEPSILSQESAASIIQIEESVVSSDPASDVSDDSSSLSSPPSPSQLDTTDVEGQGKLSCQENAVVVEAPKGCYADHH